MHVRLLTRHLLCYDASFVGVCPARVDTLGYPIIPGQRPSVLCVVVMQLPLTFTFNPDDSQQYVINMLQQARRSFDLCSWWFEPTTAVGHTKIGQALEDAAHRGVRIRLLVPHNAFHPGQAQRLPSHPRIALTQVMPHGPRRSALLHALSGLKTPASHGEYMLHQRFALRDDEELFLCSTDFTPAKQGCWEDNVPCADGYLYAEYGVACPATPEMVAHIHEHMVQEGKPDQCPATPYLVGNFMQESNIHRAYCELIAQAQELIYLETQWFNSHHWSHNDLFHHLATAMHRNPTLGAILVTNLNPYGLNGYATMQAIAKLGTAGSLWYLRKQLGVAAERLVAVTIHSPDYECFTHNKLLIVDERHMIMGTNNIDNRSTRPGRNIELALRVEEHAEVKSFQRKIWTAHLRQAVNDLKSAEIWERYRAQVGWVRAYPAHTVFHDVAYPVLGFAVERLSNQFM